MAPYLTGMQAWNALKLEGRFARGCRAASRASRAGTASLQPTGSLRKKTMRTYLPMSSDPMVKVRVSDSAWDPLSDLWPSNKH